MYETERKEINELFDNKEYQLALLKSNILKKKVLTNKIAELDDIWFVYYTLAKIYRRLNNIKLMIEYTKKSLKFCLTDTEKVKSTWMLAFCYKLTNIDKADQCFDYCINHYVSILSYDENDTFRGYIALLWMNKALLKDNAEYMEISSNIYEEIYSNPRNGRDKIHLRNELDDMYRWIYEIYAQTPKYYLKAQYILHKIQNQELKEKLKNKVRTTQEVAIAL